MANHADGNRATAVDVGLLVVAVLVMKFWGFRPAFLCMAVAGLGAGYWVNDPSARPVLRKALSYCSMVLVFFLLMAVFQRVWAYLLLPIIAWTSLGLGMYAREVSTSGAVGRLSGFLLMWILGTAGIVGFALPATMGWGVAAASDEQVIPDFELMDLAGEPVSSTLLDGKVVIMDFWASWCGPCIAQFPELEAVYAQYREDPDVAVVAVNTSWDDSVENARRFVDQRGLSIPVLYDAGGWLTGQLGITSIPHTLIIDRKGRIRSRHRGFVQAAGYFESVVRQQVEMLRAE